MTYRDLPKIVVPEDMAEGLAEIVAGVLRSCAAPVRQAGGQTRWALRPDSPDLIVALLRSAEVPAAIIPAAAAALCVPAPPLVGAHIGRELVARFEWAAGWRAPIYWAFGEDDPIHSDIARWAERDERVQRICAALRDDAAARGVWPSHVMIVDDCIHEGGTSALAVPLVIQAFGLALRPEFVSMGFYEQSRLFEATFAAEPLADRARYGCYELLRELLRGYEETDDGCVPLTTLEQLRSIGDTLSDASVAPYRTLAALYGEAALLALRPRVIAALAETVVARLARHLDSAAAAEAI